jgi:tetratricopeptide (TPR) repeat protein
MATELMELAETIADKEKAFFAHFHAFGALMVRGGVHEADRELVLMRDVAQELRQPTQIWVVLIAEAMREIFAGHLEEAEELMQRAAQLGSGAQGLDATYYYVANLQTWGLRREQGRLAELESSLEGYVQEYPGVFLFRCLLANVYAELGRETRAREELDRLAGDDFADLYVGSEWLLGTSALASVCEYLQAAEHAKRLYEALLPYAGYNVFAQPELALGSASRFLGVLATTMDRWDDAARHFEQALDMNARMGSRPCAAHTQHDHARMLARRGGRGDTERARELLTAASGTYRDLGMEAWAQRAEAEMRGAD